MPSPPSAIGTSSQSHPHRAAARPTAAATSAAVAVPRNLSGAATHSHRPKSCARSARFRVAPWPTRPSSSSRTGARSRSPPAPDGRLAGPARGGRARVGAGPARGRHRHHLDRRGAVTDGDREAAAGGVIEAEGFRVRTLALDPEDQRQAYDDVCNATLWFLHHGLYELAREPSFDPGWWEAWGAYRAGQRGVRRGGGRGRARGRHRARAGLPPGPGRPAPARRARPTSRPSTSATRPSPGPTACACCRPAPRRELLEGMAAPPRLRLPHPALGGGLRGLVRRRRRRPGRRRSCRPLAPDPDDIAATAGSKPCLDGAGLARRRARRPAADHPGRPHRAVEEPRSAASTPSTTCSSATPSWRERVVFGAFVYPSREGVPAYAAYRDEVEPRWRGVNERWGTDDVDAGPLRRLRRLPPLGGRPAPGRRAARQPDPRRPQPRGQGGPAGQRPRRRAAAQPRGRRVGRAGERGVAGPPLRHRRHRRRAPPRADPRPGRAGRARDRGAGHRGRPHRQGLAGRPARPRSTRSSPSRSARRGRRAPRAGATAPSGPSTTTSARSRTSAGVSGPRTAMRAACTPAAASRSRPSKPGRSPMSSPR